MCVWSSVVCCWRGRVGIRFERADGKIKGVGVLF